MDHAVEIEGMSAAVADAIRTLHARCVCQEVLEALPDVVAVYGADGLLLAHNHRFAEFWQIPAGHSLIGRLNLLEAPGVEPSHVRLMRRAVEGEPGVSDVVPVDLRGDPAFDGLGRQQVWLQVMFSPIRVDGVVRYVWLTLRDRSEEMQNQQRVNESEAQVAAQQETIAALREAQEHIRQQQDTIRELSTPIIEVWPGVLTLPVVGSIDERRAGEMTERLLTSVTRMRARHVILDLTGVGTLDTASADHLLRILGAVALLGGRTMIAGINPEVAHTIVELGIDLRAIRTVRSLREALAAIFAEDGRSRQQ